MRDHHGHPVELSPCTRVPELYLPEVVICISKCHKTRKKKSYYHNKFQSNNSIKSCWKTINSLIRPKSSNNSLKIDIDGNKESNPGIISEHFNNYFTYIAQNLASKIPPSNVNPLSFINHQPNTFVFFECCESEIVEIINQLKNNK